MSLVRVSAAKLAVAVAAAGLLLTPAIAAPEGKRKPAKVALTFDPIVSFTPAAADPRLAAAFAGRSAPLADLKFTPAAAKGRPSQLRVAIRARAGSPGKAPATATAASAPVSGLAPESYNLGLAVGWRRFAVAGDVAKVDSPGLGGRESAVVGVSYSLNRRLSTRVAVAGERSDERTAPALRNSDNVSVDLGGAYSLTKRIAVTGGVRYRIDSDRVSTLNDARRDSQAVYVGTAFKF